MEETKKKPFSKSKFFRACGGVVFLMAVLFLVSYLVSVVQESTYFFRDSAKRSAIVKYDSHIEEIEASAKSQYDKLYDIAERLQYKDSKEDVVGITNEYYGNDEFGDLRYYSQEKAYDVYGNEVLEETSGNAYISELAKSKQQGCTQIYYDEATGRSCMAFFVPVRGSQYVDGLLSIMAIRGETNTVPLFVGEEIIKDDILSAMIIDAEGNVYISAKSDVIIESIGNDIYDFASKIAVNSASQLPLSIAIGEKKKTACTIETMNGGYLFLVSPIKSFNNELSFVIVTEENGLISSEMSYVRYVITLTVIALVALLIGLIYATFYYKDTKIALDDALYTDQEIGCANGESFRVVAGKILQSKIANYAVTIMELRQFRYFEENLEQMQKVNLLKHIAKVLGTFCGINETYAYLGNGKFVALFHYRGDNSIREKIKLITTVIGKHETIMANRTIKLFNVGIALAKDTKKYSVQELVSNASVAVASAQTNVNIPYIIFNEAVNAERLHNEKIELEMEDALENGDFRLFLQPKYNVKGDKIDSAEALVRWFDPKTGDYRAPGEFISLFEANGFISKLDRFMYIEVLKYLQSAMEREEKQVPISVNVSLVTASASDFLSFYVENKKKYGIADGYVTIEFTESFLANDYNQLAEIVNHLHSNGIRSSLDDFGTGYASFNVLKKIQFDELKLDRELLSPGVNRSQDEAVLTTIIDLAKSLGITVVQEGVENKVMFDRIVSLGCDVIQGYYYAKAIPVEEYKLFITSNTSIKYKSLIK